jgi:hypothetical protein
VRLFSSPESRLVTLASLIAFFIAALAPLITNQPYTPFHLARILLAPLISSIAILAVPRRRHLSARLLRLSNLVILGAAASIPLGSAILPRSPALAVLYIFSGAALLTTIALTTAYLALHILPSSPGQPPTIPAM